jgi:hypothetical protein
VWGGGLCGVRCDGLWGAVVLCSSHVRRCVRGFRQGVDAPVGTSTGPTMVAFLAKLELLEYALLLEREGFDNMERLLLVTDEDLNELKVTVVLLFFAGPVSWLVWGREREQPPPPHAGCCRCDLVPLCLWCLWYLCTQVSLLLCAHALGCAGGPFLLFAVVSL